MPNLFLSLSKLREKKGTARKFFAAFLTVSVLGIFFSSGMASASEKKLKVIERDAAIHLDPDKNSIVIEKVSEGTLLALASATKFRKNWNYVYFISGKSGQSKAGYILDSSVEKLYSNTKSLTIHSE